MRAKCGLWNSQFRVTASSADGQRVLTSIHLWLPGPFRSQTLVYPGRLPSLNDLIEARIKSARKPARGGKLWNAYSDLKKQCEQNLAVAILACQLEPVSCGVFHFCFTEARRVGRPRDPDNIAGGANKLILDSLVRSRVLPEDGKAHVLAILNTFAVGEKPTISLTIFSPDA